MNDTGNRSQPGPSAMLQRSLLGLISGYRHWLSPLLPPACRFHPTCSDYAFESIRTHGPARGTVLAVRRLCRCHPLSPGGFDPVPPRGEDHRGPVPVSSLATKEVR
ncbi:MAG TPA: membrane protein insertion efficiency factor YidD [Candidatus Krumholzibacteria bacterium]|nr:membrane protein insertion efficiency factor YidD [Candidatus Krumholzibacteria bacterium]